ncbi:ribbon-helix-helix protein, CopG family [Corynebacterium singulare]|uniref:ribbon-helix-helix protein, CopG family n=1 Tax=Corynebacterium singulare TaxID=161899 RepID=UPI001F4423A8|nr:ribbon-helix-helix protein, CopG family [Corynebacterium singulare]
MISVRVEPELVERLDALAARTRRSRGTYLRMALWASLPQLEKIHWEQVCQLRASRYQICARRGHARFYGTGAPRRSRTRQR